MDISGQYDDLFFPALTDDGVCEVYNGDSIRSTYAGGFKADQLANVLDSRASVQPFKIDGTGKVSRKSFWLNVADR